MSFDLIKGFDGAFIWLDFELTGLDESQDLVLEVAMVATDGLFKVKDSMSEFVSYKPGVVEPLLKQNQWWLDRPEHLASMLQSTQQAGSNLEQIAIQVGNFAMQTKGNARNLYLAGNSIHNDRKWVDRDFPALKRALHYRMLDVSSFKLYAQATSGIEYPKQERHRALDDIHESIEELKFLVTNL